MLTMPPVSFGWVYPSLKLGNLKLNQWRICTHQSDRWFTWFVITLIMNQPLTGSLGHMWAVVDASDDDMTWFILIKGHQDERDDWSWRYQTTIRKYRSKFIWLSQVWHFTKLWIINGETFGEGTMSGHTLSLYDKGCVTSVMWRRSHIINAKLGVNELRPLCIMLIDEVVFHWEMTTFGPTLLRFGSN